MAATSANDLEPVLKILYKGQRVQELVFKKFRFLAALKKVEDFQGKQKPLPIRYSNGGGRSSHLGVASANSASPAFEAFELTRKSDFAVGSIDSEAVEASASDQGSFVRGLKAVVDAKILECSKSLASVLFRDAHGMIGNVTGTVASTTMTLSQIQDAVNFSVGDKLNAYNANNYGAIRSGTTNVVTLTGVNYTTGVLTSGSNWSTQIPEPLVTGDPVAIQGDGYGYASAIRRITGLMQWIPPSAPTGALGSAVYPAIWNGVDRSLNSLLGGSRLDASAYATVEEALIDGIGVANDMGGSPDLVVLHPAKYRRLIKELGSKVVYDKLAAQGSKGAMASIGFDTVVIEGPSGRVRVLPDVFCPFAHSWALDMSTLSLNTLGPAPKFFMEDGQKILRTAIGASDTDVKYEFRLGYRGELGCDAPGHSCCIIMPT